MRDYGIIPLSIGEHALARGYMNVQCYCGCYFQVAPPIQTYCHPERLERFLMSRYYSLTCLLDCQYELIVLYACIIWNLMHVFCYCGYYFQVALPHQIYCYPDRLERFLISRCYCLACLLYYQCEHFSCIF